MASIKKIQDLKVWQESRILAQKVFEVILSNPDIKDYPFKDQINRSSGSIMDNIAEGFGRKGNKEFRQFLTNANGSNEELQSQLCRALDRSYITQEYFNDLLTRSVDISKMIMGLIKYLNNSEMRGSKYKVEEPLEIYGSEDLEL